MRLWIANPELRISALQFMDLWVVQQVCKLISDNYLGNKKKENGKAIEKHASSISLGLVRVEGWTCIKDIKHFFFAMSVLWLFYNDFTLCSLNLILTCIAFWYFGEFRTYRRSNEWVSTPTTWVEYSRLSWFL